MCENVAVILNRISRVTNILLSKIQSARKILLSGNQSLRFGFFFKSFPQNKALCLHLAVIPQIPQKACLQFTPKPTSSGLEVEAKFYFQD